MEILEHVVPRMLQRTRVVPARDGLLVLISTGTAPLQPSSTHLLDAAGGQGPQAIGFSSFTESQGQITPYCARISHTASSSDDVHHRAFLSTSPQQFSVKPRIMLMQF